MQHRNNVIVEFVQQPGYGPALLRRFVSGFEDQRGTEAAQALGRTGKHRELMPLDIDFDQVEPAQPRLGNHAVQPAQ